jgi:transposase
MSYRRQLHDLAAGGRPVLIDLEVRRFSCGNAECGARTFAEQVPALTQRHQRGTPLLRGLLEARWPWRGGQGHGWPACWAPGPPGPR